MIPHPGEPIESVRLFIDWALDTEMECCLKRQDVQDAFPEYSATNTLSIGWALIKNWGTEASGPHIVRVDITSTSGEVFSQSRTVTMVKPGDFEFLDQFVVNGGKTGSLIPFEQVHSASASRYSSMGCTFETRTAKSE